MTPRFGGRRDSLECECVMTIEDGKRPPRAWLYHSVLTLAIILLSLTLLIVTGVLLPGIPFLGTIGTLCESLLSLHIVLVPLVALLLSLRIWRARRGKVAPIAAAASAVVVCGAFVPLYVLTTA